MKKQIAVGLDIGTTKISVIVGTKNEFGKIEILGIGKTKSTGVMRGIVANIDQTTAAIIEAKTQAEDQTNQFDEKQIKIERKKLSVLGIPSWLIAINLYACKINLGLNRWRKLLDTYPNFSRTELMKYRLSNLVR